MKRRFWLLLLTCALCLSVFVGCDFGPGADQNASEDGTTESVTENGDVKDTVAESKSESESEKKELEVSRVTLHRSSLTVEVGESKTLSATVSPSGASDRSLVWSSSDEAVATVSKDGVVKALSVGSTVITATASNGVYATCDVTVKVGSSNGPSDGGEVPTGAPADSPSWDDNEYESEAPEERPTGFPWWDEETETVPGDEYTDWEPETVTDVYTEIVTEEYTWVEIETEIVTEEFTMEASEEDTWEVIETESSMPDLDGFDFERAVMSEYIDVNESDYMNVTVTLDESYRFDESDVYEYINSLLFDFKEPTDGYTAIYDQPIRFGDSAYIYYTGYLNGEEIEGGSNASDSDPYELVIGLGAFIPGFEEALIGVIPANTSRENPFRIDITFPDDHYPELAGQDVVFEVYIEYVVQYDIPELNDEFVQNVLGMDCSADEYYVQIYEELEADMNEAVSYEVIDMIIETVLANAVIHQYPEGEIDSSFNEYVVLLEEYKAMYESYGITFESFDDFASQFLGLSEGEDWQEYILDLAKYNVEYRMVYYAIFQQQPVWLTEEEVMWEAEEIAESYSDEYYVYTAEEIIDIYGWDEIREMALFGKVEDIILMNCTIEFE